MPLPTPLRIAILVNSEYLEAWQSQMLEKIQANGTGVVVLAIIRGEEGNSPAPPVKDRLAQSLVHRYLAWDKRRFKSSPDPFAKQALTLLNPDMVQLRMTPETSQWTDKLAAEDAQTLRGYDIDVVVRLGWRILKGDILRIPRCGVWSYHHGDNTVNRGGPPALWEHYHNHECTGVTLQILTEALDDGVILAQSKTATDPCSIEKTRCKLYWRSVDLLPRKLAEMHRVGWAKFSEQLAENDCGIEYYSQPLLTEKSMDLAQVLRLVLRGVVCYVRQALFARRYIETWKLYFQLDEKPATSLWRFKEINPPSDRYWADPHVIKRDGCFYVFVEELMFATHRGRIAVIPVHEDGTVGESQTVLARDYHLSYPFVFEHDGETFMIPESSENRSIDLYRCARFPDQWEHVKTLMDGVRAVDTTLYQSDGRWWLFTNRCDTEGGTTHDELHLYSAEHFMTDSWQPHALEVVKSDVRSSRSAGAIFEYEGRVYRPAQDCSVDYGFAVQLLEINELSQDRYRETAISKITPDWAPELRGVHTFNYVPGMTVVDAKIFVSKRDIK